MANYDLVVNSTFQPFSYERYMQPVLQYKEAYDEVENALSDLETKASIWDNMINKETDTDVYNMYKAYADDLTSKADLLAREGLKSVNRRDMLGMKRRYSSEIIPIEQAYNARKEEIKEQQEGKLKGIIYEGDASKSPLKRYLKDPSIKYNLVNSNEGYARVASAAKALSSELRNYEQGKPLSTTMKAFLQEHGYSGNDVNQAINDVEAVLKGEYNERGNGILQSILNKEMHTSGVDKWENKDAQKDYFNRISPALYNAVGETKVSPYEDYEAKQKVARQLYAPIEIVDANGKPTGRYFSPILNMTTDKDGHPIQNNEGDLLKVGTGSGNKGNNKGSNNKGSNNNGDSESVSKKDYDDYYGTPIKNINGVPVVKPSDLKKVNNTTDAKKLGLEPLTAVVHHRKGWQWGKEEDLGEDNRRLVLDDNGNPIIDANISGNDTTYTRRTQNGKSAFFGSTESNLVTGWGDINFNNATNLEFVDDYRYEELVNTKPEEAAAIDQAATDAGIQPGENYVLFRSKGTSSSLFGSDDPKYSYIIFKIK